MLGAGNLYGTGLQLDETSTLRCQIGPKAFVESSRYILYDLLDVFAISAHPFRNILDALAIVF